jgi:hypothetical protein
MKINILMKTTVVPNAKHKIELDYLGPEAKALHGRKHQNGESFIFEDH